MSSTTIASKNTKKNSFKMPHTYVTIFIIILIAVAATWIVPAGEYVRIKNAQGISVVDPNQFNYLEQNPVNLLSIPLMIVKAFSSTTTLMMMIFFSGGAFHILTESGALQIVIAKMVKAFSNKLYIFIPILTLLVGLVTTTQAITTFIAFVPIMIMISLAMGLDSIVGTAIIILGGAVGFSTGTLNLSTTVVAQEIAGLPLYSGIEYRTFCFIVFYILTNFFLVRYALAIRKNPELSPMYDLDLKNELRASKDLDSYGKLTLNKILVLLSLLTSLIIIVVGGVSFKWGIQETTAVFLVLGVVVGLLDGKNPSQIATSFLEGCKKMVGAAFIVAMARVISTVMFEGKIIDTIVLGLSSVLNHVPAFFQAPSMFIANMIINIFITSGSGQATAVMPIMIPLADLVGVTRQTAILAFNFGDGFCNYVLPTASGLMSVLGAANIPFDRWIKFMWKVFLVWVAVGCVLVMIAQAIKLGPM